MQDIISQSPNLIQEEVLKYNGEIRFGPADYSLMIDQIFFGERVFGSSHLWPPNYRFFVVQEWEMTKEYRGQGVTEEFEIEFLKLSRWENLK